MFLLGGLCNMLSNKLDSNQEKNALLILPDLVLFLNLQVDGSEMVLSRLLKSKSANTAYSFHNLRYTKSLQNG